MKHLVLIAALSAIASPAVAQTRWTVPTQPGGYPLIPMPDAVHTPPPPVIAPARPGLPPTLPLGYPLIPMPDAVHTPPPPVIAPARPGLPPTLPLGYPLIPMPAPTHGWGR